MWWDRPGFVEGGREGGRTAAGHCVLDRVVLDLEAWQGRVRACGGALGEGEDFVHEGHAGRHARASIRTLTASIRTLTASIRTLTAIIRTGCRDYPYPYCDYPYPYGDYSHRLPRVSVPLLRLSVPLLRLSVPLLRVSVPLLRLSVPVGRLSVPPPVTAGHETCTACDESTSTVTCATGAGTSGGTAHSGPCCGGYLPPSLPSQPCLALPCLALPCLAHRTSAVGPVGPVGL